MNERMNERMQTQKQTESSRQNPNPASLILLLAAAATLLDHKRDTGVRAGTVNASVSAGKRCSQFQLEDS